MPDELATRLHDLLNVRALIGEEAYHRALAELQTTYGDAYVTKLLHELLAREPSSIASAQQIGDSAQVAVAVAGNIYGDITVNGSAVHDGIELVRGYCEVVRHRYQDATLPSVPEPQAPSRNFRINLEQVYLHVATSMLTERETFDRMALKNLDVQEFIDAHMSADQLPADIRSAVTLRRRTRTRRSAMTDAASGPVRKQDERLDLRQMLPRDTVELRRTSERVTFIGPQLVSEAIVANSRLVLLGAPGSGKSTALRYIALTLANARLDSTIDVSQRLMGWSMFAGQQRLVPILAPLLPLGRHLSEYPDSRGDAEDMWEYLVAQIDPDGGHQHLHTAIADRLQSGDILLMLDGLDEIVGADVRRKVVQAIVGFTERYPRCRIVVTCRVRPYENAAQEGWALHDWPNTSLADWTIGQMRQFTALAYTAHAPLIGLSAAECDERIRDLHAALLGRPDLQQLGTRPLLLAIMVVVHLNDHELPEDRGTLYDRCIDLLLGQWDKQRNSAFGTLAEFLELPNMDVNPLRRILCDVALHAHQSSTSDRQGGLGRSALLEMIGTSLEAAGHPNVWAGAKKFLEYIDMRAGLLQPDNTGETYVFAHQAFQEYMAGLALVRESDAPDRIMLCRNDDHWRLPIILGVIHLIGERSVSRVFMLFTKLLLVEDRTVVQQQRDVTFAAEIGMEIGWNRLMDSEPLFAYTRQEIAKRLSDVVEGQVLTANLRVRAGNLLEQIGDLRMGVAALPPLVVPFERQAFTLGSTAAEAQVAGQEYSQHYRERGETAMARRARSWPNNEINEQLITLAPFALDRYLITNAQYALFIADDGYNPNHAWWDTAGRSWLQRDDNRVTNLDPWQRRINKQYPEFWMHPQFGHEHGSRPVVGVSWYEAMAFCHWLSQHATFNPAGATFTLPSEAEWEYAARGMIRRSYPWGAEPPDEERANFGDRYGAPTVVGCFALGATSEGVYDLGGNVWEWTRSHFTPYPYDPHDGREVTTHPERYKFVARGAGWHSRAMRLRAATRNLNTPDNHFNDLGFRVCQIVATTLATVPRETEKLPI